MTNIRIHYFQHAPFESPGYIQSWAEDKEYRQNVTRFYEPFALPYLHDFDWLVVMGGPMGVNDNEQYPWLSDEKFFIQQCIKAGKTVIGICLGAQLIASALGAAVYPNKEKEIGWFPVTLTATGKASPIFSGLPVSLTVLHWHGDTFDLPPNAALLAETAICKNQAFVSGDRVIGLQFHFEATDQTLPQMIEYCGDELVAAPYVQTEAQLREGFKNINANNQWLETMLNNLVSFNKV
jgi:GMP synthase-like glutamine amidotransferase